MDPKIIGTGWSFPPAFTQASGTVEMSRGARNVEESLRILVGTIPGERVMLPRFGMGSRDLLFESMDTGTQTLFFDRVRTAILRYEPRIEVIDLRLNTEFLTDGRLELVMEYQLRATNSRFNFVYPFYVAEGSQIETT